MSHARIAETTWTDPKIRKLSPEGKLLFLYLLSNPHRHYSGLYYLPIGLIPIETGLKGDIVNNELTNLNNSKILTYDINTEIIFIRKMFLYQAGGEAGLKLTDKQKIGVENHLKTLHGSFLIDTFLKVYKDIGLKKPIPIESPLEEDWPQSQSQSQSQSQKARKNIASPKKTNGDALPFFKCQFFEVDLDYRNKLKTEYPLLTDETLKRECSKMEDWVSDNRKKKKFKANGRMANPKLFIKNWLGRLIIQPQESGTRTTIKPSLPKEPPGILVFNPNCPVCHGDPFVTMGKCQCGKPENPDEKPAQTKI